MNEPKPGGRERENAPTPPATAAGNAEPVIRVVYELPDSRLRRVATVFLPAWVISSMVHVALLGGLILAFGRIPVPESKVVVETTLSRPDAADDELLPLELTVESDLLDPGSLRTPTTDPVAGTAQGLSDLPPVASGTADDLSAAKMATDGNVMTGLGSLTGGDEFKMGGGLGAGGGGGKATFLGTTARGSRFAIVADNSGSMRGVPMEYLKNEIAKTLNQSSGNAKFFVTFFNSLAVPQPLDKWAATRTDIAAVNSWVRSMNAGGGTAPLAGFQQVFLQKPPPDVVFFMTDGQFDPRVADQIVALNKELKTPAVIHTIALGGKSAEPLMRQIAAQTKGTYRFVPLPGQR